MSPDKSMFDPEQVMQELIKTSVALGVAKARNEALERALFTTATTLAEIVGAWERGASGETIRALARAAASNIAQSLQTARDNP